jgi:F-type H+-transporting ATPase subunit delta
MHQRRAFIRDSAFSVHHLAFSVFASMTESRDTTAQDARTAAQIEADVGVEHIAGVYAKGLLDTTERAGATDAVLEEFDVLMTDVLDRFPHLEDVLASTLVSPEEKSALIDRLLKGHASATLVNFLKVVARHGRLDCLRAIHFETHVFYDKLRNRIPVRLSTATPLDPAAVEQIVQSLRTMLGGEPIVRQEVDPSLIGGAVLRVGDIIYDGSVANQLQNLRQQMIEKSVHEIQSRRDRFRYPAGN